MGSGVPLPIEGGVWGGAVPRNLKKLVSYGVFWWILGAFWVLRCLIHQGKGGFWRLGEHGPFAPPPKSATECSLGWRQEAVPPFASRSYAKRVRV